MSTFRRLLGLRLSVWYATVFVISTVVLVGLGYALMSSSLAQRDHDIIRATLREYASRYELGGLPALQRSVELEERTGSEERLFVRVLGPDADALFVRMPPGWRGYAFEDLGDGGGGAGGDAAHGRRAVLEVASARLADGTILQVGKSNEIRLALLRQFQVIVGLVSIAALAIGVLGGLLLTRSTVQPIYDLIAVVQRTIRTGRTDTRVRVRSSQGDAVDELSALFNTMLDRINSLIAAMGESLDNVAHDLRTPLARLRGIAERALQSDDPADAGGASAKAAREALADCLEESDRILSMLNTLMDISEAETGALQLRREPVALRQLLAEAVELYEDVADAKQIAVTLESGPDITLSGARDRLRQVFANLLDNAIKYTPSGGTVRIAADADSTRARVTIEDTGSGIAPEHLPRIWDRLYRADPSRSERGLGLGLSLVKAYVEAHGGEVEARSEPGRGSTFIVRLPLAPPETSSV
ncbi:MAG TPA: HAMP domain-containing sensor histidine kinase [Vicinamibacterales bacterium]|jgi:signal transduction histidine kinase|nr:HAMP domain-containing sensor histidine kinase [Vicinamibacterales bacterium]